MNHYFVELHARYLLEEARAARARASRIPRGEPRAWPALTSAIAVARALYARATRPRRLATGAR